MTETIYSLWVTRRTIGIGRLLRILSTLALPQVYGRPCRYSVMFGGKELWQCTAVNRWPFQWKAMAGQKAIVKSDQCQHGKSCAGCCCVTWCIISRGCWCHTWKCIEDALGGIWLTNIPLLSSIWNWWWHSEFQLVTAPKVWQHHSLGTA